MYRTVLLALAVLVLAAVSPALAGTAPAAPQPAGCGGTALDLIAPAGGAQVCKAALPAVAPAQPEFMATTVFHGYCRCGCRNVKDCNTDADCGGSRCLGGISCC